MLNNIIFETTTDCNLDCRFCYNCWKRPEADYSPFNSYKKSIKTLKRLFKITDVQNISFSGGEPFLSERFSELVLFARMKHKNVSIISNGNVGTNTEYDSLMDLGVSLFEFPVHSYNSQVHDYLTKVDGSWKKSVQSINYVSEKQGEVVAVIVITKANYKDILKTLEFLQGLNIKRVMLNRFNIGGSGISEIDNLQISNKELRETFKIANNFSKNSSLQLSSNVCTPRCILPPEEYPNIIFSFCNPNINQKAVTVDANGNMRICNHSPHIMGNIFKEKLKDILNSSYAQSWKTIIPEYCSNCKMYHRCFGGCRAAAEQLNLSIDNVDPIIKLGS